MTKVMKAELVLNQETIDFIKNESGFDLTDKEVVRELEKLFQDLSKPKKLVQVLESLDFWNY